MITVEEARELVVQHAPSLGAEHIAVNEALGRVLAADIRAGLDLPAFRQSAMDGYAVCHEDLANPGIRLSVVAEIPAGDLEGRTLESGQSMRIFTGAPVPEGATAVVMQEKTSRENSDVIIHDEQVVKGLNIREIGEQIRKGAMALPQGTPVTPATVGYLSMLGLTTVEVYRQPEIAIIVTGDELVEPGQPLKPGQIYESNGATLQAALENSGFSKARIIPVKDDYAATKTAIDELLGSVDTLLLSGGISVGDYDYVGKALNELNTEQVFYKVMQKPGKPLYFGKNKGTLVFALPGNPASALVCFYAYVLPALRIMSGHQEALIPALQLPIRHDYHKKGDRSHFLKARITPEGVEVLEGQGSFILHSFAIATALVYIPADREITAKGELVTTYLIP